MDERLAALDRRVAEAADAWLADSRDTGVYVRLVTAIETRRAYLNPLLDLGQEPEAPRPVPEDLQPDEVLDDLNDDASSPVSIGERLQGDVRDVLSQLRADPSPDTR